MRVQGGFNQPFQGKKREEKGDHPFFVIVHASIDQALANPGVFQDIKADFLMNQFDELETAKDEVITRVNQFRDADTGYIPSFYIWKALAGKFSSYIKNSNFLNNDPHPIESMGIQDQWRFEPQTNGFLSAPYQALSETASQSGTPAEPAAEKSAEPAKPSHHEKAMFNWVSVQQNIEQADAPEVSTDTDGKKEETEEKPSTPPQRPSAATQMAPVTLSTPNHPLLAYFKCPISKETLTNPYITPSGETYNYDALKRILDETHKNPVTAHPLAIQDCIPNLSIRRILEEFKEVASGRSKLLLCPFSRLPFITPILINPLTEVGAALLSIEDKAGKRLFESGMSYSREAILNQQKRVRTILPDAKLTPKDLIPNLRLTKFLKALASSKR